MSRHNTQRGSALLVTMVMAVSVSIMIVGLVGLALRVGNMADLANQRIARVYAAEAGLERVKQIVNVKTTSSCDWLDENDSGSAITFTEGGTTMTVGDSTVYVTVSKEDSSWYLVQAYATDSNGFTTILGMTANPRSYFSDYARFVSDNSLSIGSNVSYDGKVHSNGNVVCSGSNIKFYEDVTAHGTISKYSDTKFLKNATAGVAQVDLPEAAELESLCTSPPEGSTAYDYDNSDFISSFNAATGKNPNSTLTTTITFNNDKMTVVNTCTYTTTTTTTTTVKGKTTTTTTTTTSTSSWTQTDVDIPDGNAIYTRGTAYVTGNISRRTSVITPKAVYITNSVRYVDDSGGAMWQLKDSSGNVTAFSSSMNTWSSTSDWTSSSYSYEVADDWSSRQPTDSDGNGITPCLGIVSGSTIYLTGSNTNREVCAALFTSGDVVRTDQTGKKNLHIHGSIITTDTNPLSSYYTYRCYAYDPYLEAAPPPGFPSTISPTFRNWHVVSESTSE